MCCVFQSNNRSHFPALFKHELAHKTENFVKLKVHRAKGSRLKPMPSVTVALLNASGGDSYGIQNRETCQIYLEANPAEISEQTSTELWSLL